MRIGLRHCLIALALAATGLGCLVPAIAKAQAAEAALRIEGEGDSAALLVAQVEAAFPLAAPGAVFFALADDHA